MASLFLKLGKEKLELAVIDTLLHTFPCKVVSLSWDRPILFQSIPNNFCGVIGVNKRDVFILNQFECRVQEEEREERHLKIRSYSSDNRG